MPGLRLYLYPQIQTTRNQLKSDQLKDLQQDLQQDPQQDLQQDPQLLQTMDQNRLLELHQQIQMMNLLHLHIYLLGCALFLERTTRYLPEGGQQDLNGELVNQLEEVDPLEKVGVDPLEDQLEDQIEDPLEDQLEDQLEDPLEEVDPLEQ